VRVVATAAALLFLLSTARLDARNERSLTHFESGTPGSAVSPTEPDPSTIAALREKQVLSEATIRNLTDALTAANMELEIFKRHLAEANLRLEALGLASNSAGDTNPLEARMLQAIRELRILKEQQRKGTEQLLLLSESIQVLLSTSAQIHPQARMAVETELRKATDILTATSPLQSPLPQPTLQNAQVLDIKDDLSLLVADIGSKHGVKLGMPLRIQRNGDLIGVAKVVEVRERISGAVIQNLTRDTHRVIQGDQLIVDTQ
jgi:hypothetical protein